MISCHSMADNGSKSYGLLWYFINCQISIQNSYSETAVALHGTIKLSTYISCLFKYNMWSIFIYAFTLDTTVEFASTEYTGTEESGSITIETVRSFHLRATTLIVEITPFEQSPPSARGLNCLCIKVTYK